MPLQATSGAASYDAFGGGVAAVPNYIEDVFSTWLYTGNGSTQTITNGIDLAGKGGLVWAKKRSQLDNHVLLDTSRGLFSRIFSNTTGAAVTSTKQLDSFNADGFTIASTGAAINESGQTYASWTFREQPKFFDIVTYTGNDTGQAITHNLGSVPGCIIVKCTTAVTNWVVYHRSLGSSAFIQLSTTGGAVSPDTAIWGGVDPTSTQFTVGTSGACNASGNTYVAYLFAHNAGGFGLTGTDNVISCGSFTTNGSGAATVNLGYEPQWVLVKRTDSTGDWLLMDNMRGLTADPNNPVAMLRPNLSNAENTASFVGWSINATGFGWSAGAASATYIYIAIRRGPMKVPTTGTSVFGLNARTGTGANATVTGSAGVTDLAIIKNRGSGPVWAWASRLTRISYLSSNATTAETTAGTTILQANPWDVMDGIKVGTTSTITNASGNTFINYLIDRAPGFFDQVCYTGDGNNPRTINHNLGVAPEMMIVKLSSSTDDWSVYHAGLPTPPNELVYLNLTNAVDGTGRWSNTAPTATVFSLAGLNQNGGTYIAYLFATCPGVSKVGSYTGNGSSQTINCGFTGGARFVLIKRTDSTGDWYVWDTARGIVSGNDPYLRINTTAAEVTSNDTIDTDSTGFVVNQVSATDVNVSSANYIFLAIA